MKKIVALVLSLVMVLGLATTAMAATGGATLADALANKTETVEVKAGLEASASLKTFPTYQVFVTKTADKSVSVLADQYVKVPSDVRADYAVVDGTSITYLAVAPAAYNDVAAAVEVAYIPAAEVKCGDVYVETAAEAGTYYLYKGEYYEETATGSTVIFNVNGMAVWAKAAAGVKTADHTYVANTQKVAGVTTVTEVVCSKCKASFAFVEGDVAAAVAKFGAGNYVDTKLTNVKAIYVAKAGVASAPVAGDKVESAQTFDAGIAMYVGMSVMAAAGSAVVLKKKD